MTTVINTGSLAFTEISESILNSLRDQICLIDTTGIIRFINRDWNQFALRNGGDLSNISIGTNYFQYCESESLLYDGLQAVIGGKIDFFDFEYPCHSPSVKRWFLMQATPFYTDEENINGVVIRHIDITNQKLLELQLIEQAEKDSLTSLFNRRYFEEQLVREAQVAHQNATYLSLLSIDIDNFKEINDTYGHLVGDKVLKQISLQIMDVARPTDTVARLGGDEFMILLPKTDKRDLELIAGSLTQKIQRLEIQEQGDAIKATVSIGGKSFISDFSINTMTEWVDKALYRAKDKGKNQAVII